MNSLLQLSAIGKSFAAVQALKGVSFDLLPGEVHALLGENGAGKSTLIKIITGAHQPDSGDIKIGDRSVTHLTPALAHKLGIACIYQQPALFPDLTIAENIALRLENPSAFHRVRWIKSAERARDLLHRVGAGLDVATEVRDLSMPQQQLVEIACALGAAPRILIMDEPTASLTQKEQHLLFKVVRELRDQIVGVIYISHRLEEIFQLADRVTVLRDGASVGTTRIDDTNESALISKMVGRELPSRRREENQPRITRNTRIAIEQEGTETTETGDLSEECGQKDRGNDRGMGTRECAEGKMQNAECRVQMKDIGCKESGIKNVTFDIHAGEIVALAGLVGAGRTELARILFGITPATSGELCLDGHAVRIESPQDAIRNGIAYLPEDRRHHGVILEMPIAANISMAVHPRLFPSRWMNFESETKLALQFIRDLDIRTSGPDAPGGSLSGGNQQKVALARWLAAQPKFLILDEPTQGVDVGAKGEIHKIIRQLAKTGIAILLISSDLPEVLGMADRIGVMREGRLVTILSGKPTAHDVMSVALGQSTVSPTPS